MLFVCIDSWVYYVLSSPTNVQMKRFLFGLSVDVAYMYWILYCMSVLHVHTESNPIFQSRAYRFHVHVDGYALTKWHLQSDLLHCIQCGVVGCCSSFFFLSSFHLLILHLLRSIYSSLPCSLFTLCIRCLWNCVFAWYQAASCTPNWRRNRLLFLCACY